MCQFLKWFYTLADLLPVPMLAAWVAMPPCINEPFGAALFQERRAIVAPLVDLGKTVYLMILPLVVFK